MTTTEIPVGTEVRVRPETHRAGEVGTVVRVPASERPARVPAECSIPVAFAHVSGPPLWFAPEELEATGHDPYVDQDGGPDEELRRAADVDQLGTQAYVAAVQVVNDPQITTEEAVRALELAVTRIQALIAHAEA